MRPIILFFLFLCVIPACPSYADSPTPTPSITVTLTPPAPSAVAPSNTTSPGPAVTVAAPAAPPQWAQDLMVQAEKLPVVGPIVTKVMLWAGILGAILTTLVGALLGILNMLTGIANLSGLTRYATLLAAFRDGKVMYWLKFFSLFNAKQPPTTGSATIAS